MASPPWLQEWPALALKLALLHAAHYKFDALAWTTGDNQAARYRNLGEEGLRRLYDKTLPKEINRILKPFGVRHEMLGIYVPETFSIKPTELGYAVYDENGELIGKASGWKQAQKMVPSGGLEKLRDMHGVRLLPEVQQALASQGLYAWAWALNDHQKGNLRFIRLSG